MSTFTYTELAKLHEVMRDAADSLERVQWYASGLTADTSTGGADLAEASAFAESLQADAIAIVAAIAELTAPAAHIPGAPYVPMVDAEHTAAELNAMELAARA